MKKNKIELIVIDLWQTLVDCNIKPSDIFFDYSEVDRNKILKKVFIFDGNIDKVIDELITDSNKERGQVIKLWEKASTESFLVEGAENLLISLKKQGYKLCLLTNIDKYGYENFKFQSILKYFDYQFLSYKQGIIKPDNKCWENIKKYFKIDYNKMCMIGDSLENDIIPAEKLGLETVLININTEKNVYLEVYERYIKK